MGREQLVKIAAGVFERRYDTGNCALLVCFTFRGVRCKEVMTGLDPKIKNHVKYATATLASIKRDIGKNTFNYLNYFPESKRARIFGHAVSSRTVKQIAESWLSDVKRSMPHSTYNSYKKPCDNLIFPNIGPLRARDVTAEHLRDMFRNADISLKTARNYSIPVRAIFQRALDDDDIERNPMDKIKLKSLIPMDKHKTNYKIDPLSEDEIKLFLRACEKHRREWLNYFTFAFYSGLRTSELFALEWKSVDWNNRSVRVCRAIVEGKAKGPKTAAGERDVVLVDMALQALQLQRAKTELAGAEVFTNPTTGDPLMTYRTAGNVFDALSRLSKIRRRNQYQTRHSYASNVLSQGANPLFVANQLGHTDVQMVFKVYAKWITNTPASQVDFGSIKTLKVLK